MNNTSKPADKRASGHRFRNSTAVLTTSIGIGLLSAVSSFNASASKEFTPTGALSASNAEGTIPDWTGGLSGSSLPRGYEPGNRYIDPFPSDEPLFVITAEKFREHIDHLALGHQALFERFPSYQMPVYPTRRSVVYPKPIQRETNANIDRTRLVGVDAIEGAKLGFPFPLPRTGAEVLWNHRLRYRGDAVHWDNWQSVVFPGGDERRIRIQEWSVFGYANLSDDRKPDPDSVLHYTLYRAAPTQCAKQLYMWHEALNPTLKARNQWGKCADFRAFRLAHMGHDDFSIGSEKLRYFDMLDMFSGEFDRYTYRLLGKREILIPYNAYRLSDGRYTMEELLTRPHFNQEGTRYELHRVWVVEASLRPNQTHSISKRRFYVDEDSWTISLVDLYESDEELSRFQEGHLTFLYDVQAVEPMPQIVYDLRDGRYFATRLITETGPPDFYTHNLSAGLFTPGRLNTWHNR